MVENCPYCLGTGWAPSDDTANRKTECGFCDKGKWHVPPWGTPRKEV